MKTKLLTTLLIFITYSFSCSLPGQKINDEQHYGQKLPGKTPEIYSPKFSFIKGEITNDIVLSPDGREACYVVQDTSSKEKNDRSFIFYTQMKNGEWKNPEIAYFVANQGKGSLPQFSPEGDAFSYSYKGDFWTSEKKSGQWSLSKKMPEPVNSDKYECGFSFVKGDRFYFASAGRPEGKSSQCDIYCAKKSNGIFGPALNLSSLNTERSECVLAASPDEKYIVFTRYFNKSGNDAVDLYISFHKKDGTWTVAKELSPLFNSPGSNHSPRFSSDCKYFFFNQSIMTEAKAMETRHYWVSTRAFDEMNSEVTSSKPSSTKENNLNQMSDIWEVFLNRRSVRNFKPDSIPQKDILKIIDAARMAPTSGNQQPWKFLVIRDKDKINQMKEACMKASLDRFDKSGNTTETHDQFNKKIEGVFQGYFSAPVYIVVLTNNKSMYPDYNHWDGPLAAGYLMLAARALGYGTVFITDAIPDNITKDVLQIPDNYTRVCITPLGVPVEWPVTPEKKKLEEMISYEKLLN